MPDITSNSQTYNVPDRNTGSGVTLAGFGKKSGQLNTSVSLSGLPHEVGGGVSIKSVGHNRLQLRKPQYKGKKIR
jgi:hypothetical protein